MSQVSLSSESSFLHWFSHIYLQLFTLYRVRFLLMAPVGSSAPVALRTISIATGSSLHHLTTPSNWNLWYLVYLMIPGGIKQGSRCMTEKGKMIPYWEFFQGQDGPSSYKQVVDSWWWLYKKTFSPPLVTLKELIIQVKKKVSDSKF